MWPADFSLVIRWWGTLFLFGAVAYPLTKKLFSSWFDRGYLFSKAVGMATVTFLVYLAGTIHLFPFTVLSIVWAMVVMAILGIALNRAHDQKKELRKKDVVIIIIEEVFFFAALLFWSWVKGHEPSIHGLEKFMDFGFTKSILNSQYFPAPDMWYAGFPINYYYFGHTVMAVLTRFSGIDLTITFNLMLATLFALTFTMSFSIGAELIRKIDVGIIHKRVQIAGGLLIAFLVTLAGNMQTIYAFTKGYFGDQTPPPFWTLLWKFSELGRMGEGLDRYWYANATRFIPYTIHEFPSYSFVVSDVHGHVLSLPFVLLAIALLIRIFGASGFSENVSISNFKWHFIFYGFLAGVLLMTNALDGPIYLGLFLVLLEITFLKWKMVNQHMWKQRVIAWSTVIIPMVIVSLPFLFHFHSFVSGLAINCPPDFLANHKIGPFLFEGVEKCQHSPLWMLWLLWGFFIFCGIYFIATKIEHIRLSLKKRAQLSMHLTQNDLVLVIFFIFSILLIIFPEFFYFKDIYPMHFRSNTMFKLGYQAFIMFSIMSGYVIVRTIVTIRSKTVKRNIRLTNIIFLLFLAPQLFLVSIYPVFSVRSYFDSLRQYQGLYGLNWFMRQYPNDFAGINWLNIQVQHTPNATQLVLVEADGDSYTDSARYSAFTGIPAVIGWPVHEWLWRGSYDVVSPRREEVRTIYTSTSVEETTAVLHKYHVTYLIVGALEYEKYPTLDVSKFDLIGELVFTQGITRIYKIK